MAPYLRMDLTFSRMMAGLKERAARERDLAEIVVLGDTAANPQAPNRHLSLELRVYLTNRRTT